MNGNLLTTDFILEGIKETPAWQALSDRAVEQFVDGAKEILAAVPAGNRENEGVTENTIIKPILNLLGWEEMLEVQNLSARGREEVPDLLLFEDAEHRHTALREAKEHLRYRHGLAITESKRWELPLDRSDQKSTDPRTPSSKILWYMRRVAIMSDHAIEWGMLTNGRMWRLYWSGARSISEDFLELDLATILELPGTQTSLLDLESQHPRHFQKVFLLLFGKEAFRKQLVADEKLTFHEIAVREGRKWERRVSDDLGAVVFENVFPELCRAMVAHDPSVPADPDDSYLEDIRRAALVFLYRLLFVFNAEDRHLLPIGDASYHECSISKLRSEIASRIDDGVQFSMTATGFHSRLAELYRAIANGDASIGLPPYNGGLFEQDSHPVLERIRFPDGVLAPLVDRLSREHNGEAARWINYRDLSVQHLGSIYERILEYRLTLQPDGAPEVHLSRFARKGSGSYYTHDDLVNLIIRETVQPLIDERLAAFEQKLQDVATAGSGPGQLLAELIPLDPASAILSLKICDPAMGSGHFLVSLVDYLTDHVLAQMVEAPAMVAEALPGENYESPLVERIGGIRRRILMHAETGKWNVPREQLDDRHLVRRLILKRVIFGVDKNPMAVELAKVALWLHTFTVGAPLSFLDHHLKCGDALLGERITSTINRLDLLLREAFGAVEFAAEEMNQLSELSDADLEEAQQSKRLYQDIEHRLGGARRVMDMLVAGDWLTRSKMPEKERNLLDSVMQELPKAAVEGPVDVAAVKIAVLEAIGGLQQAATVERLTRSVLDLTDELLPLHWELAFPTVWRPDLATGASAGGFDAVIGNPPWDRMKLQEVEWFADRSQEIARQPRAADRKRMIAGLARRNAPLWRNYQDAKQQAEITTAYVRRSGHYPLLSGGDINIYSLFVERAQQLVKPRGIIGLLVPSGIAADKGASKFFKSITKAEAGTSACRLGVLYDFENKKVFFPDIHASFKFSVLVFGGAERKFQEAKCAFFLHNVAELKQDDRTITLSGKDFEAVNPNTGTAPIFRTRRDADITKALFHHHPVFHDQRSGAPESLWRVRYHTMFHMTNDSGLFKTAEQLDQDGFYRVHGNLWRKGETLFVPLYEGKMVQAYDHRAASVVIHPENLHRPNQAEPATLEQHQDPAWVPTPLYWVDQADAEEARRLQWVLCFKDVTAPTNIRTMIAAIAPGYGFNNKTPLLLPPNMGNLNSYRNGAPLLLANLNSLPCDYIFRQKVHGQTLNLFILEQIALISPERFEETVGGRTLADFVREQVLRLSYTATDLEPFARDMGYTGDPFPWDEEDRRHRLARLDALFFHLYGIDRDDAAYILETFPIVKRHDETAFGRFRTKDLVLGYMNAVAAGDLETVIDG